MSAALAVCAAAEGLRVGCVDLDPQRSLIEWWRRRGSGESPTVFDGIDEAADAVERADLSGYDWLFLDSPPAFLQIIQDSVQAADLAIIPIKPSMVDLLATQDTIAIAREAGTPFLCVFNDVVKGEKIVDDRDEGEDFAALFQGEFARPDAMKERMARERKAARTPAQKARKGPVKTQSNFRATAQTLAMIDELTTRLSMTKTDVIELAIRTRAEMKLGSKQ